MTQQAEREIQRVMEQPDAGIGEFNRLIETFTESAIEGGMPRPLVLTLLAQNLSATAAAGRRNTTMDGEFNQYKSIQTTARGAQQMARSLQQRHGRR